MIKKFLILIFIVFINNAVFANEKVHVAYCIDNNYPLFTMLSINSILINNTSNSEYYFHIVENNLSDFKKFQMKHFVQNRNANIEFIHYDTTKIDNGKNFFNGSESQHITRIGIVRLLLPKMIPNIDKILYIDADTLIIADLLELWNIDLGDNFAGMAEDYSQYIKTDKSKKFNYYNSGVILMNAKLWRENNISEKLIEYLLTRTYKYPDQDALNNVLTGKIKKLDFKWNFQYLGSLENESLNDKKIIHYITNIKPWSKILNKNPGFKEYFKYWNKSYLCIYKPFYLLNYLEIIKIKITFKIFNTIINS